MTSVDLPPDDTARRFVIACLIARHRPQTLAGARALAGLETLDWAAVASLVEGERVGPLLHQATRRESLLPGWLADRCRQAYLETGLQNALRLRDVAALLARLESSGIRAIVLKGTALAEAVYGNIALRPMSDVDLLVRRACVEEALAILRECGYEAQGVELAPDVLFSFENELLLRKRDRLEWHLELHWSLFDSPFYQERLAEEIFWDTAEPLSIEGAFAQSLSPELTLLHLCGHLTLHHRGQGLLWQADVAEVLHQAETRLDWDLVLAQSTALHLVLPVRAVLQTAAAEWNAPVPPEVLARLAALQPDAAEVRVYNSLMTDHRPAGRRLLDDLVAMPGWASRLRFLRLNLFPAAAYMDERYGIRHPALRVLYYPYRWGLGLRGILAKRGERYTERQGR